MLFCQFPSVLLYVYTAVNKMLTVPSFSLYFCFTSAEAAGTSTSGLVRPIPVCPVIVKPEIDIEVSQKNSDCNTTGGDVWKVLPSEDTLLANNLLDYDQIDLHEVVDTCNR